jgi:hypothetical protein
MSIERMSRMREVSTKLITAMVITGSFINPQFNDFLDPSNTINNMEINLYDDLSNYLDIENFEVNSIKKVNKELRIVHAAKELFGEIRSMTEEESEMTQRSIELMSESSGEVVF